MGNSPFVWLCSLWVAQNSEHAKVDMFNQNRKHGESQVMQELVYQQDELVKERQKHRALKNPFF